MTHAKVAPASMVGPYGVVLAFIVYAAVFALLKGDYSAYLSSIQSESTAPQLLCQEVNTCMRVGVVAVAFVLTTVLSGVADVLFTDPHLSSLVPESPWGILSPSQAEKLLVVRSVTFILVRFVFLLPILWLCMVFYRRTLDRFVILTLLFVALAGWPLPIVDWFYAMLAQVADWPLAYYNFTQRLVPHDFGSIGYVVLLYLYIARRARIRLWECAALTLVGQLIFENNGIVTGVALFVATLLLDRPAPMSSRLMLAGRRLAVAGLTSVTLATLMVVLYRALGDGVVEAVDDARTPVGMVVNYFVSYWDAFGRTNLSWANVLAANFAIMVLIPFVFGAGVGVLLALTDARRDPDLARRARTDCLAGIAVAAGFCVTVAIGFFVSQLSSDLGRQLAPLVAVTVVFAAKMGEWLCRLAFVRQPPVSAD